MANLEELAAEVRNDGYSEINSAAKFRCKINVKNEI